MIRDHFRVMVVDLATGRGTVEQVDGRDTVAGGSGLAAHLFLKYGKPDLPWKDPVQPFILAIGPLARLSPGWLPILYNRRHLGVLNITYLILYSM